MMAQTVQIEICPCELVRCYHFRREVTPELLAQIRSHRGIEDANAYGRRYQAQVIRSRTYSWEEVEPAIVFEIEAHESIGEMNENSQETSA